MQHYPPPFDPPRLLYDIGVLETPFYPEASAQEIIYNSIDVLDEQIANIDCLKLELARRKSVLERIRSINVSFLAPIRRVPPEILSTILNHVAEMIWEDRHRYVREPGSDIQLENGIALVCKLWRRVALDTPAVWSYLSVPSGREGTRRNSMMALRLMRSNATPLRMRWMLSEPAPSLLALSTFHSSLARICQLEIDVGSVAHLVCTSSTDIRGDRLELSAPLLESLTVYENYDCGSCRRHTSRIRFVVPRLATLALSILDQWAPLFLEEISVPLRRLILGPEGNSVCYASSENVVAILRAYPSTEILARNLGVYAMAQGHDGLDATATGFVLPLTQSIRFIGTQPTLRDSARPTILSASHPNIKRLHIQADEQNGDSIYLAGESLLASRLGNLRELMVYPCAVDEHFDVTDVVRVLRGLPHLESIVLVPLLCYLGAYPRAQGILCHLFQSLNPQVTLSSLPELLCPRLTNITLGQSPALWDDNVLRTFTAMIRSRSDMPLAPGARNSRVARLQTLCLVWRSYGSAKDRRTTVTVMDGILTHYDKEDKPFWNGSKTWVSTTWTRALPDTGRELTGSVEQHDAS